MATTPPESKTQNDRLYVNLVWHFSQTEFLDGLRVQLSTPAVRHNATSVYFSLLSALQKYPKLHTTLSLPGETLRALQRYVLRMREFADLKKDQFDYDGYLKKYAGQADPWLDMLLVPSSAFGYDWDDLLLNNSGHQEQFAFAVSPELLKRFPEYVELMPSDMQVGDVQGKNIRRFISAHDKMKIKFFFAISHFDEQFLRETVELPLKDETGEPIAIHLNDYFVVYDNLTPNDPSDDYYLLAKPIGEDDCRELAFDTYKIMESVLLWIEQLSENERENENLTNVYRYNRSAKPAISLITSPQNNALIPLIYDTESVLKAADSLKAPLRFSHPEDAKVHISRAIENQKQTFQVQPEGFFPTCGAISSASMRVYDDFSFRWLLTGKNAIAQKTPSSVVIFGNNGSAKNPLALILSETDFSSEFETDYSRRTPAENLTAFGSRLKKNQAESGENLLTLIFPIDERLSYFHPDFRAHAFLESLLAYLADAQEKAYRSAYRKSRNGDDLVPVVTCTPSEYLDGASARQIAPHKPTPISAPVFGMLATGGIARFLGDEEEQTAWSYLSLVRGDFSKVGEFSPPADSEAPSPEVSPESYFRFLAWESIFAAENALWFEHFGSEHSVSRRKLEEFDREFLLHLQNVYLAFEKSGEKIERRKMPSVLIQKSRKPRKDFSASRINIDGFLDENEWYEDAGILICDSAKAHFPIRRCLYGLNNENLFLALDAAGVDFSALFRQKDASFLVTLFYDDDGKTVLTFRPKENEKAKFLFAQNHGVLEMQIPFSRLNEFESNSGIFGSLFRREKRFSRKMELGVQIEISSDEGTLKWPENNFAILNENSSDFIDVIFEVDATSVKQIPKAIYICGDKTPLGKWKPNTVRLFDDGSSGDRIGNDKIWSRKFKLRRGETVQYKYTNSGTPGVWESQELGQEVRSITVEPDMGSPNQMIVRDIYGVKMR
ncbi:carbohydrate-binding module family 20 domain-containing protein [Chloroherpeton thalassium]|uniref:carbohydrate-binding module family 20 domain-containing protein n=1 Tax=Chloroherpeton thalassium TaxID=100716 RepID=UPI00059D0791|nr:carbohydrate-binding module family 20 domain-containing protein [Chloroherpeton thalassium]